MEFISSFGSLAAVGRLGRPVLCGTVNRCRRLSGRQSVVPKPATSSKPPRADPKPAGNGRAQAFQPGARRQARAAICSGEPVSGQSRTAFRERTMSIKSDRWIRRMAAEHGMIEPFEPGQVRAADGQRIVSYGTSSYGYDVRCADEFKIFTNINSTIVDPKAFDARNFVDFQGTVCIIPPNSFALARTVEYFRVPRDTLVVCLGKSTYARCGIIVNVTPLEPEWEGHVTLEFSNTTPLPARIYAGEGCAQMLFFQSDEVCETSYKDRGGKYMGQRGVTLPRT
jgi:dCTP deaminase